VERQAASTVLARNLRARAAGEWAAQCSTLSRSAIEQFEGNVVSAKALAECSSTLEALAKPLKRTEGIRADMFSGSTVAFRVKGDHGYALFRGSDGKNYATPMEKEDGTWKVDALLTKIIG
jgi:hypothetical protein